uniref:CARD domain-containing protein n=1 Tax=Salarias fasciatus TaxID=181472 RepID=A0A672IDI3_SALFA
MERLKSEQSRLRAWLSEDPDHIVDQCGDILSMNQCKEVQKQTSASEKIRVLLEIIINKGEGTCQSFIDILELNRDHYRDLQQFFSSAQGLFESIIPASGMCFTVFMSKCFIFTGSFTPTVVSDRGSLVSINEVKDTKGKSYSNKMEVVSLRERVKLLREHVIKLFT